MHEPGFEFKVDVAPAQGAARTRPGCAGAAFSGDLRAPAQAPPYNDASENDAKARPGSKTGGR
ncbi:MAG: hypothetical protein HY897_07980 [Deltaproteobacteria bacterium]|nr:hypothetical protein [Deltaproteobacteria bacterium]